MKLWHLLGIAIGLSTAVYIGGAVHDAAAQQKASDRVFELRTYYALPGKMPALHSRFRDHTCKLLEKHGMTLVGFWVDSKKPEEVLVYLVAHNSKDAAAKSWDAFRKDPAWIAARDASEKDGKILSKVESVYMNPTDYSKMK
jgi:hypothetical protein